MIGDVKNRLASFGCAVENTEVWVLDFIIQKATNHILNACNITSIPEELYQIAVDMVAGEFLQGKKASGQLEETAILSSGAVKEIKEGDTTISFEEDNPSRQLNTLISFLMRGYGEDLISYRCMKW